VWQEHGVQPVVRRVEVDYLGFARHEEELELEVEAGECGRSSAILLFTLRRSEDGEVVMRARQTLAFINARQKPSRTPDWFLRALSAHDNPAHGEEQSAAAST